MDPITATTSPAQPSQTPPPVNNLPPINQPAEEKRSFFKSKKGIGIIIAGIVIVILIITGVMFFINSPKPQTQTPKTTVKPNNSAQENVRTYPKFKFTYQNPPPVTNPKTQLSSYFLKTSFSEDELASFGAKFGFPKVEKLEKEFAHFSDFTNPQARGFLVVNTKTGSFDYQNLSQENKILNPDVKKGAAEYLTQLGFSDNLVECDITYKNTAAPDITYIECHRSWEKLGAPLFNLPGIMNITNTTSLSDLKLGYNDTPISNPLITDVSTGQNGINRPNDFNTATFSINRDGIILTLTSNLRWITNSGQNNLLTPEEAFKNFTEHKSSETIALPAKNGDFDWEKVFESGTTTGKNAVITDYELIYSDVGTGQTQKEYAPYYLIRGNVLLDTGYRVNFVQILEASSKNTAQNQIAQAQNNLQLKTFQKTPSPTAKVTAKPSPMPSPTPRPFNCSTDAVSGVNNLGQNVMKYTVKINGVDVGLASFESAPNVFFLNHNATTLAQVENYRGALLKLIAEQFAWNYKNGMLPNSPDYDSNMPSGYDQDKAIYQAVKGMYDQLISNPNAVINPQLPTLSSPTALYFNQSSAISPCYLTGLSPTIFLYSEMATEFTVLPSFAIKTDPYTSSAWKITANKLGELSQNNVKTNYLYYEFNAAKVKFSAQEKGFVLSVNDIKPFAPKLAKEMKLNSKEAERLLFELEHAAKDLPKDTKYIKISLVPDSELNTKLPLRISPKPEFTNRYHFVLSKTNQDTNTVTPHIPEAKRGTSTLVELGASAR